MINMNSPKQYDNIINMIDETEFNYLKKNIDEIINKYLILRNSINSYNEFVYKLKDLYDEYLLNFFDVFCKQLCNGLIVDLRKDKITIPQDSYNYIKKRMFQIGYENKSFNTFNGIFATNTKALIWIKPPNDENSLYPMIDGILLRCAYFLYFIKSCNNYKDFQQNIFSFISEKPYLISVYKDEEPITVGAELYDRYLKDPSVIHNLFE